MRYWRTEIDSRFNTVLTLDLGPKEKQNKLKSEVMRELGVYLKEYHPNSLVIASAKPDSFCAGADVEEIREVLGNAMKVQEYLLEVEKIFLGIYEAPYPVVAAVSGVCLGGGLELAMVCHERIAADHPKTMLGLPETSLGIIPGFGGTQTLPRIVGMQKALELILGGAFKKLNASDALKCGLVSKVVASDKLIDEAKQLAKDLAASHHKNGKRHKRGIEKLPIFGQKLILHGALKMTMTATKGAYPAPVKAIEAVSFSSGDMRRGLQREHQLFSECVRTPEAENLINIYFLKEEAKSRQWIDVGKLAPFIYGPVGIVGAGVMGQGIALAAISANLPVILHDSRPESVYNAVRYIEKNLGKDVARGKLDPDTAKKRRDLLSVTYGHDLSGLKNAGIVIEAIIENLDEKHKLLTTIEKTLKNPDAIIATNTSSLLPSEIAAPLARKDRFCAMHFFNPAERMELVEIAGIPETNPEKLAAAINLAKMLRKIPIVLKKECAGLVVNRVLVMGMSRAMLAMLQLGMRPWDIDRLLERYGFMMGPFKTADLVGFDTAEHVLKTMAHYYPENYPDLVRDMDLKENKAVLGKKTGRGFYVWHEKKPNFFQRLAGQKDVEPNLRVDEEIHFNKKAGDRNFQIHPQSIVESTVADILQEMREEAQAIMTEKVMDSWDMLDLALILGAGICPNRRGLIGLRK